ncbi:unnamed protein product [Ilex paraguariensis]|uniref:Major facilitator superfamily (MFS) profile domain-containing protein n=1 Tax=Ilex paraguariensis TaxID=185542 RepID=A0ABC8T7T3_9AQUA
MMCCFFATFGCSPGPLTWLVPGERPTEIRPVGQGICVAVNFIITFVLSQISLTMLCHLKYGIFLLYAGLTLVMTIVVAYFVPETIGIPLKSMNAVWKQHWQQTASAASADYIWVDNGSPEYT